LAARIRGANTALHALHLALADGVALGDAVSEAARATAVGVLHGSSVEIEVDVITIDRAGTVVGRAGR
jgi:cobalt-precorrin-5B (C1)-methyltransferase